MQKSIALIAKLVALSIALTLTLSALSGCGGITGVQFTKDAPQPATAQPAPSGPPPQQMAPATDRARLHTDLAVGYYERGQMDVAINELNQAVAADPSYAPAYNIFGLVYAVIGDDRKAEESFTHALALTPNDSDIHHNWGWYLCQHKREAEAIQQFEIAVQNRLYRTPEIALVNAGRCAQAMGDDRNAESYFKRALAAQPGNPLASYGLAVIAYKAGRYQEARTSVRGAMQTTNPAPEVLYLGMCVEQKLGDSQAQLSYTSQLRNRYPDAPETKAITTEKCP